MKNVISREDLIEMIPAVMTSSAKGTTSDRYSHISTIDVVDALINEGWMPTKSSNAVKPRTKDNYGFQPHLVRMAHPNLVLKDEQIEILVMNSHDGKRSYRFDMGIFRMACANSMVVGESFKTIRAKHVGFSTEDAVKASYSIIDKAPELVDNIDRFKGLMLTPMQQQIMAQGVLDWRYEDKSPIRPVQLLSPRRHEDSGTGSNNSLWKTYNVIQENTILGGLRGGIIDERGRYRRKTTRAVKGIDAGTKLNKVLWDITSKMAETLE